MNTSRRPQNTAQCVNQMALCRFLWVVRKGYTILNLQKHCIKSPISKTYMNCEFSLTLVNLKIMSLERVPVQKKECATPTLVGLSTNLDPQKYCIRTALGASPMSIYPLAILGTFSPFSKPKCQKNSDHPFRQSHSTELDDECQIARSGAMSAKLLGLGWQTESEWTSGVARLHLLENWLPLCTSSIK